MSSAIVDRIRKLQAMAESARTLGNAEEAAAFAGKVQEMLDSHRLSESVLDAPAEDATVNSRDVPPEVFDRSDRTLVTWFGILLDGVAKANRCRSYWDRGARRHNIIGTPGDRDIVVYLTKVLSREGDRLLKRYRQEFAQNNYGAKLARNSATAWRTGFAVGIRARMKAKHEEIIERNPHALTLRTPAAVDRVAGEIGLRRSGGARVVQNGHYSAGKDASQRAVFHDGVGGRAAAALQLGGGR